MHRLLKTALLFSFVFLLTACISVQTVRPYPHIIQAHVKPGDTVFIHTNDNHDYHFRVHAVTKTHIIGVEHTRIAYSNIGVIKREWFTHSAGRFAKHVILTVVLAIGAAAFIILH